MFLILDFFQVSYVNMPQDWGTPVRPRDIEKSTSPSNVYRVGNSTETSFRLLAWFFLGFYSGEILSYY